MRTFLILAIVTSLSACSSVVDGAATGSANSAAAEDTFIEENIPEVDAELALLNSVVANEASYAAMQEDVLGYYATAYDAIPETGSVAFTGQSEVTVSDGTVEMTMIGDAFLVADFSDGTVIGAIDDIEGWVGDVANVDNTFAATSEITIGGFSTVADTSPNSWSSTYVGLIDTPEGEVVMSGTLDGLFYGTRAEPDEDESAIKSLYGEDQNGDFQLNGEMVDGTIAVAAHN